MSLGEEFPLHF